MAPDNKNGKVVKPATNPKPVAAVVKPPASPEPKERKNKIIIVLTDNGNIREVLFEGNAASYARGGRIGHWKKRIMHDATAFIAKKRIKRKYLKTQEKAEPKK